jgi:hypothetical protein
LAGIIVNPNWLIPSKSRDYRLKSTPRELQSLVERILGAHKDVRFAALFDARGEKLAGGMKDGTPSLDPPKKSAQVDRATAVYPAMLAANERYFGKFGFLFAEMEKCNALAFQVETDVFLVVTTDPPTGLDLVPKIKKIIAS